MDRICDGQVSQAPKLFLSSPSPDGSSNVAIRALPQDSEQDHSCSNEESPRPRPKNWRSQTAFELSSSISCEESEASFIINEFLQKTAAVVSSNIDATSATNASADPKMESYV